MHIRFTKTISKKEKEIIIAGIARSGLLAQRVKTAFEKICSIKTQLIELHIDKNNQAQQDVQLPLPAAELKDNVIIPIDDVLTPAKRSFMHCDHF